MKDTAPRIAIVTQSAHRAEILSRLLDDAGWASVQLEFGAATVEAVQATAPALLLMDVVHPGPDAFTVLEALGDAGAEIPVLIIAQRSSGAERARALRLGADDVVSPPCGRTELFARIHALLRRAQRLSGQSGGHVVNIGDAVVDLDAHAVIREGASITLSPKELELLLAFLHQPRTVLSRHELLSRVWRFSGDSTSRTLDIHVSTLRRKLEPGTAYPRHIVTVHGQGYRFDP